MCGIAGVFSRDISAFSAVRRMSDAITHRGPDDCGYASSVMADWSIHFAHRRLAILDLSPLGHQPMVDQINGSILIFNGEIYNFRRLKSLLKSEGVEFRGGSDTEIVLNAIRVWGTQCALSNFEGMFALAYFNRQNQSVCLARDMSGIKPLYYFVDTNGLIFASEVRAIVQSGLVPKNLNTQGISEYLNFGAFQHPNMIWNGIQPLAAGRYIEYKIESNQLVSSVPKPISYASVLQDIPSVPEAVQGVRSVFRRAVRDHLISDVPVAVFLSAGIDSTLIASIAGEVQPDIQSFTIGSDLLYENDERVIAAETAKRYGLKHASICLPDVQLTELFSQWLDALDTPSIDGLNTFMISWAVRQHGFKVALSGLGSDELFCGYPSFRDVPSLLKLRNWLRYLPRFAQRIVLKLAVRNQSEVARNKLMQLMDTNPTLLDVYLLRRQLMNHDELQSFGFNQKPLTSSGTQYGSDDDLQAISGFESTYYQGNMLLRDSDVMSMAHGLELRTPFLDQQLIQYVSSLPAAVRQPKGSLPKHLLRQAFADVIPDNVIKRKKTGFVLPIREWMMGPMRDLCEHTIQVCVDRLNFPRDSVYSMWNKMLHPDGAAYWSRGLALVALGHYVDRHCK